MTDSGPRGSGELTDAQLDQLLAETNRELLENVEATSDPSRTLTAIMARGAQQDRAGRADRRARSGYPGQTLAVERSNIRARASDVAHARRSLLIFGCATVLGTAGLVTAFLLPRQAHATAPPAVVTIIVASTLITCVIGFGIWWRFGTRRRARSGPGQALVAIMGARIRARAAARLLDDAYCALLDYEPGNDPCVEDLALARQIVRRLARAFARSHDRDRADAFALRAEIDSAIDLARGRDRALARVARGRDRDDPYAIQFRAESLNGEFARTIAAARRIAIALARALDERQVDVSGADLSWMDIEPDLLNGAIWTHQTTWPPGVVSQVRAHSTEIRPDVYQVRLGTGAAGLAGAAPSGTSPA